MKRSRRIELEVLRQQNRQLHYALSPWVRNLGAIGVYGHVCDDEIGENPEPLDQEQLQRLLLCAQFLSEVNMKVVEQILRRGFRLNAVRIQDILTDIQEETDEIHMSKVSPFISAIPTPTSAGSVAPQTVDSSSDATEPHSPAVDKADSSSAPQAAVASPDSVIP